MRKRLPFAIKGNQADLRPPDVAAEVKAWLAMQSKIATFSCSPRSIAPSPIGEADGFKRQMAGREKSAAEALR